MKKFSCEVLGSLLSLLLVFSPVATSAQTTSQAAQTPAPNPGTRPSQIALVDGTPVNLTLCGGVSSATAHEGDTVEFHVSDEVKVAEIPVIPEGGHAWGTVTKARKKGMMGRNGKLGVRIDAVRLVTGEEAVLRTSEDLHLKAGETKAGQAVMDGALVLITVGLALPILPFIKGQDITLPEGWRITAFVNGRIPLDKEKFLEKSPRASADAPGPAVAPPAPGGSLEITSNHPCAEIALDGRYVGLTPFLVSVPPGEHLITVRKKGFRTFEMKLETPARSLTIAAELQPEPKPK